MAKDREWVQLEFDSITLNLPKTIRQGEHRKIERMIVQYASEDFMALKDQVSDLLSSLGETNQSPVESDDPYEMSEPEVTATLIVVGGITQEDVDDIERSDFLSIKDQLEVLYKQKTPDERALGKEVSAAS